MTGVASPEQEQMIKRFAESLDLWQSPVVDLIKLARLYIFPMYEVEKAMDILEVVLKRESRNPWARYWLAYCLMRFMMDRDSLIKAKELITSYIESNACNNVENDVVGAMYNLLVDIRDDPELFDLSDVDRISFLEKSVHLAPKWVMNRLHLARAYMKLGRTEDAITHLEVAQHNVEGFQPSDDELEREFEFTVTGCTNNIVIADISRALSNLRKGR